MYNEYVIPMDIEVRVPSESERADRPQDGWFAFYKLFFKVGLHLPIPELARQILLHYNLASAQLMPKAWLVVMCCVMLGENVGRQLTLENFLLITW